MKPHAVAEVELPALGTRQGSGGVSSAAPSVPALLLELTKPRITQLVTITAAVGFIVSAVGRGWSLGPLMVSAVGCLLGVALASSGASALNQWAERDRDRLMPRTAGRPLPAGALPPGVVLRFGLILCVAGVGVLWLTTGLLPALLCALTITSYLLAYTPMKVVTPTSTLVGAVPGALPPLIGWTAGASVHPALWTIDPAVALDAGGWVLFAVLFVWQIPHFLALAWMYRRDYAAGGYRMLPLDDPRGVRTAAAIVVWSLALMAVVVLAALVLRDRVGPVYAIAAILTTAPCLWLAVRFWRERSDKSARAVFLASIIQLPVVLLALAGDALASAALAG